MYVARRCSPSRPAPGAAKGLPAIRNDQSSEPKEYWFVGSPLWQPDSAPGRVFLRQAVTPPSTTQVRPVTKPASSLARKATTAASSSGRPMRPSG